MAEAVLMLLPALVALIYLEPGGWSFVISAAVCAVLGAVLILSSGTKDHTIYAREGFAIVALGWLLMSALGALPFVISREIPSYIDAFFETVSGFTTTGASILRDIEALSHCMLFWRSFSHFIGGMGVLIFIMAVIPNLADRSIHIMRAEVPGPVVGKLVPRIRDTALILYLIYISMTVLETVLLVIGGMPLFDSIIHAFGTAGTGGFSLKNSSITDYSPYLQWVIAIFMSLFGVNFNIYYLLLRRKFRTAAGSAELRVYYAIMITAAAVITVSILPRTSGAGEAIRLGFFQASSIMTTTGYVTAPYNDWPQLAKTVLFILMFIGSCAGSTGGGVKVTRVIMLFKSIGREIKRLIHPRAVARVGFEGKPLDDHTLHGVGSYFALYIAIFVCTFLLISVDGLTFEENVSAAASCINNIGPAFGRVSAGFFDYSGFSKVVLSLAMLGGRLEIYPLLLTFLPSTWLKK